MGIFVNFPTGGWSKKTKISQVSEGGSQNLGTVPKLYLVINYDGFPKKYEVTFIVNSLSPIRFIRRN